MLPPESIVHQRRPMCLRINRLVRASKTPPSTPQVRGAVVRRILYSTALPHLPRVRGAVSCSREALSDCPSYGRGVSIIRFPRQWHHEPPHTEAEELTCDCGSVWVELVRRGGPNVSETPGAVILGRDRKVIAITGAPRCAHCGTWL